VLPGVVCSNLWREDIAEAFLYLMRNGYSSGTIVTVDGGSVLV
jgi:hypothetical protein